MTRLEQGSILLVSLAVFDKLRQILHVDEAAYLVIKEDIENFYLNSFFSMTFSLLFFVIFVTVGVDNFKFLCSDSIWIF